MPSKKFIIATLAVLLLIAGIFWLSKNKNLKLENRIVFQKQGNLMPFQENTDSDWESVLSRASTYTNISASANGSVGNGAGQLSETEKLSRNFLSQYLNLKLASGEEELSEEAKQELISSLMDSIGPRAPSVSYILSDIRISPDNSKTAIRNYGNQLGSILKRHLNPEPGAEIFTFKEAIEKNDESKFKEIEGSVKTYEGLINDYLGLIVPSEIKDPHLKLINSFVLLKDITIKFQNFLEDPIGGWIGVEQYADALAGPFLQLVTINNYFKDKGIVFSKDEDGYFIQEQ